MDVNLQSQIFLVIPVDWRLYAIYLNLRTKSASQCKIWCHKVIIALSSLLTLIPPEFIKLEKQFFLHFNTKAKAPFDFLTFTFSCVTLVYLLRTCFKNHVFPPYISISCGKYLRFTSSLKIKQVLEELRKHDQKMTQVRSQYELSQSNNC